MKLFVVCGRTHSGFEHARAHLLRHKSDCTVVDYADVTTEPEEVTVVFAKIEAAEKLKARGIEHKVLYLDTDPCVVLSEGIALARANNTPLDIVCQTFLEESKMYSDTQLTKACAYRIPIAFYAEAGPALLEAILRFSMEVHTDEED